jgi:hypothetical protein
VSRTGLWYGTVTKVISGGYQVKVPRYDPTRIFGSTAHPVAYPTAFSGGQGTLTGTDPQGGTITITAAALTVGQRVLVGFLENDPDHLVILRPA